MVRILVADDDAAIRVIVQKALEAEGYQVVVAERPSVALALARAERFALLVSDVDGMNGFLLYEEIAKLPGSEKIPVLFLSGADERAELDIARKLAGRRLLLKPFALDELVRAVKVALGVARSEKGAIPVALEPILSRAAAARESGLLTVVNADACKRFVLREGTLVFASSNEPTDAFGQALLRAGVLSEEELAQAVAAAAADDAKGAFAHALASMRKLTPEQCAKVFVAMVRESLLDVFLWDSGTVEWMAGAVDGAESPFPLAVEVAPLCLEGVRRCARWSAIRDRLPAPDRQLERAGPWPVGFPTGAGEQSLARQIDRGLSFGEIVTELRGQRYAVGLKVARLIQAGVVHAIDPVGFTGSVPQELSPEERERARSELGVAERLQPRDQTFAAIPSPPLDPPASPLPPAPAKPTPEDSARTALAFAVALMRFRAGDLVAARAELAAVLAVDPMNTLARLRQQEVEEAMVAGARQRGITNDRRVRLAVPISELLGRKLFRGESFLLSRLVKGSRPVGEILGVSPLPEYEVLSAIERFLLVGILADEGLPLRMQATYKTAQETIEELTRAVSKSELSLETKRPLSVGSRFVFEIGSPDLDQPLQIRGIVTRVVEHGPDLDGRDRYGMTVKYLFDSAEERARVEAAVERILSMPSDETRREYPRIPTAYRVVESGDTLGATYTLRNLSEGGMMLVPDSPDLAGETVLVGTRVALAITAAGQSHEILGTVVWNSGRSRQAGALGVQFDPGMRPVVADLMRMRFVPQAMTILFG